MNRSRDIIKIIQELRDRVEPLLPKNLKIQLNYDALQREVMHAVNTNLDRFDKNEIYAPCDYLLRISKTDTDQLKRVKKFDLYQQKLERSVQEYIRGKGYLTTEKTIRVRLEPDERLDAGYFQVDIAFGMQDNYSRKTIIRPPAGQSLAFVEWLNGPHKGEQIPITRGKAVIGRITDDNHPDIGIEDKQGWVGRNHAEIEQRGSLFYIRDLRSQNGTKLEMDAGVQMLAPDTPTELPDNTCVLLADEFRLRFHISDRLEIQARRSQ